LSCVPARYHADMRQSKFLRFCSKLLALIYIA
jgi:hypothetical protein